MFCSAKGGLLQCGRPCFEDEKSAFKGGSLRLFTRECAAFYNTERAFAGCGKPEAVLPDAVLRKAFVMISYCRTVDFVCQVFSFASIATAKKQRKNLVM